MSKKRLNPSDKALLDRAVSFVKDNDSNGLSEIGSLLTERNLINYDPVFPLKGSLLNFSILERKWGIARHLILLGADINQRSFRGVTPLMNAASFDKELSAELIKKGADLQAFDSGGENALHHAASSSLAEPETLRLLVSSGIDVNARDNCGRTPLHFAASQIDQKKIRLLLSLGADPKIEADGELGDPAKYLQYALQFKQKTEAAVIQECLKLLRGEGNF